MVLDQGALGLADGLFHGVQLLGDIHAGAVGLEHADDAAQMPFGALQALDDGRVALVQMRCGRCVHRGPRALAGSRCQAIPPGRMLASAGPHFI
ncbi:hypothetical protein D3C78_1819740 [compost metagenome]